MGRVFENVVRYILYKVSEFCGFKYGGFIFTHVCATRRAIDACQIGKERVLSAGLLVYIQSDGFATEQTLKSGTLTSILN